MARLDVPAKSGKRLRYARGMASLVVDGDRLFLPLSTTERILGLVANDPEAVVAEIEKGGVRRPSDSAS
jgi:hypothetical protein